MEAKTQRIVKSGWQFDHLFPKALFTETTVKKNALVEDTVRFIPEVIAKTRWQVKRYVDQELKYLSLFDACEKLWHFIKDHIRYKKDETGKEQVRSPRRLWGEKTGDCDCFTVFIGACLSLLSELKNKKGSIMLRITKYGKDHFQHIYPVVITEEGKQIILDCVVEDFNYEEPYTEKKDFQLDINTLNKMDLNYLDGVPMKENSDTQLMEDNSELGKLFDFLKRKTDPATGQKKPGILQKVGTAVKTAAKKVGTVTKKTLNVINKVNPATVLLRAGVLASMKLNVMKVSQRLKYAYLSDAEAQKRGVDMVKFQKLKQIKDKIEKIFYGAGGDPKNFKEAVLTGKGNEKREVPLSGLGNISSESAIGMNQNTPLTKILGQEMYYSEFMDGTNEIEGLGSLGEPATGTAIAAASGVLASIAALLKNLGNLFPKKNKEAADFENVADANAEADKVNASSDEVDLDKLTEDLENESRQTRSLTTDETTNADNSNGGDPPADGTWWERNKKWLKPTLWGTGIATTLGLGYLALRPKKGAKKKDKSLEGVGSKPKPKKKGRKKAKTQKVKNITLK
ncbi:MAG TPA: hypothetical protein PK637_13310 [Flavobacteriales bacterium]|nr:hypothetical protein [Flavobacteriales bacterium]HRJ39371.1 hypothetical protein [Flavobacteriales bacterium]